MAGSGFILSPERLNFFIASFWLRAALFQSRQRRQLNFPYGKDSLFKLISAMYVSRPLFLLDSFFKV